MALREIILEFDAEISEAWKYRMPFFLFRQKMFCYLWIDRKTRQPYIGIVEGGKLTHPALIRGSRARMKIIRIEPEKDIPIKTIYNVLEMAQRFYQ
ncbi:MAG: DUF1801 domain-containing protein [Acidobacteria bacterium]|nr:DUF1801 domain-containing protein [Acidobacteriota bacterium]